MLGLVIVMGPEIILLAVLAGTIGAAIGTFTGLVPGIHVNTAATILLGAYPFMENLISGYVDPVWAPVLISCCIMSASAVHSFVDFVPSVFIGVPDSDDTLSVLPGHRLMMDGRGMVAVRAAAIGSVIGSVSALALSIPLQWILLQGAIDYIDYFTTGIICLTIAIIIYNSSNKIATIALFIVSGIFGYIVQADVIPVYGIIDGGTMLFPLLTGLFGIPPLLERASSTRYRKQRDDGRDPVGPAPGFMGVVAGLIAGWFPGVTATAGATLMSAFVKERNPARFISMTASIGTVTSVFSILTLSVSGSGRSGTTMVIKQIIGDSLDGFCSGPFLLILFSIAIASVFGYAATIGCGKFMSQICERIPADLLNNAVLILITILVVITVGPFGLPVLILAAVVGSIPPSIGVGRVCLIGCLMLPVLLS